LSYSDEMADADVFNSKFGDEPLWCGRASEGSLAAEEENTIRSTGQCCISTLLDQKPKVSDIHPFIEKISCCKPFTGRYYVPCYT